jgi:hypothetical protein
MLFLIVESVFIETTAAHYDWSTWQIFSFHLYNSCDSFVLRFLVPCNNRALQEVARSIPLLLDCLVVVTTYQQTLLPQPYELFCTCVYIPCTKTLEVHVESCTARLFGGTTQQRDGCDE